MLIFSKFQSEFAKAPEIRPTYDIITCVYCYQFKIYSVGEKGFKAVTCKGDKRRVHF